MDVDGLTRTGGPSGTGGLTAAAGDLLVLVGTMKGAFVFRSGPDRREFQVSGPHFPGHAVYALAFDGRAGRRRLLAGTTSSHWGAVVRSSDDLGRTWTDPAEGNVRFPAGTDAALAQVWQLTPAGPDRPDTVWAGVQPAALFRSDDAGETFELVRGLWDHPHRPRWMPGGGGLCLHTIVPDPSDPDRMWVAISTGGVYRTEDGGGTWQARNRGIRAVFLPEPDQYPEFGQCVHKVAPAAGRPERLYLQHHWGVYRSDDAGESWTDIGKSLSSDFGFPIVAHPSDPDRAWVVPLTSDEFRCTPDGRPQVWRTLDAGASWEPLAGGLPERDAWLTVLRDGFTTDGMDPAGLYFGTRTGQVFASADEGERWRLLAGWLPPVVCVKAAVVP
ncbi:MAG TPA: exo-alpha-sialidase [Actinomycetes bacterium]|nr:exo-alpha-sialidase [Actinomycetes bacterium]